MQVNTRTIEIGGLTYQYLGKENEFDMLKISWYEWDAQTGEKLGTRGAILKLKPENLWAIADGCEYPHLEVEKPEW